MIPPSLPLRSWARVALFRPRPSSCLRASAAITSAPLLRNSSSTTPLTPPLTSTSTPTRANAHTHASREEIEVLHSFDADVQARIHTLAKGVAEGNRTSLSKAITLVESTRPDHRRMAQVLLALSAREAAASSLSSSSSSPPSPTPPHQDGQDSTATSTLPSSLASLYPHRPLRLGIMGPPGAGKSTFIEALGVRLARAGLKVCVLAIDPSSAVTGGSILGDKTRMFHLCQEPNAYVRPSPTRGTLGGIAERTAEVIELCESAGYDIVLVETVGVGQSEIAVYDVVDVCALLVPPGGGDELQGIKKGIMEAADLIIVNKADGDLLPSARRSRTEYSRALRLLRHRSDYWTPRAMSCSAHENTAIDDVWKAVLSFQNTRIKHSEFDEWRTEQRERLMWKQVKEMLVDRLMRDSEVKERAQSLLKQVKDGPLAPGLAAEQLVNTFLKQN
uniref:AAA+ ATPase domain-containing protein n=1 Tax=Palpitomonas bilix TaxID=652834 RepID=A0A7S3GGF0_9EUKA|mmetsp:Transcript_4800/g.10087  ORF Transcript_4800/g.10087 Transcript_4800/m.10087 type:complete len:447 (+) Transcript_4800:67-1407(+)